MRADTVRRRWLRRGGLRLDRPDGRSLRVEHRPRGRRRSAVGDRLLARLVVRQQSTSAATRSRPAPPGRGAPRGSSRRSIPAIGSPRSPAQAACCAWPSMTVGDAFTRVGGRWRRASIDHGRRLTGVACPLRPPLRGGRCEGRHPELDGPGGRSPPLAVRVVVGGSFRTLSCPTTHFCAAQGTERIAVTADPTGAGLGLDRAPPRHRSATVRRVLQPRRSVRRAC